ncbi:MAG: O-antigen ligase family protein [Pseudomonadota bacterium]
MIIFALMSGLLISFNPTAFGVGIRIQASDFLIPIILFFIVKKSLFQKISNSFDICIISSIFTGIFLFGALKHWLNFGNINFWCIKKIIGYCICIGYFFTGILLYEKRHDVTKIFIITSWFMGAFCLILYNFFPELESIFIYKAAARFQGFMGNPNAYGFFFAFALLLQISLNSTLQYNQFIKRLGFVLLMLNLLASSSRSAWGAFLIPCMLYALKNNKTQKYFCLISFIFCFYAFLIFNVVNFNFLCHSSLILYNYFGSIHCSFSDYFINSINERIQPLMTIMPAFFEHPIAGIGLGGAMTLHHGQEQYAIHNTALWFLIEMGIIGFAAFTWFVYKLTTALRTSQDVYIKALIFPMLSFAIASLANELFYQRYFWLFAGMIMCDWVKRSQQEAAATF